MSFPILRFEKAKSLAIIGSRAAHNLRANPQAAPHANPAAKVKNFVLVGPSDSASSVVEAARARIQTVGKVRSNAVMGIEVLMAASPDFFSDPSRSVKDWQRWQDESMSWLSDTFGPENVISAVLHRDESTPHIQALVVPIHAGKLRAAHWLDGPAKLSKHQDIYAARLAPLRLRRGERSTKARHTPLRAFYRLAETITDAIKRDAAKRSPAKLPHRNVFGKVSKEDWDQLAADLTGQNQELARLRAESIAGRIFASSGVGEELQARTMQAQEDLAEAQMAANASRKELDLIQKKVAATSAQLAILQADIQKATQERENLHKQLNALAYLIEDHQQQLRGRDRG